MSTRAEFGYNLRHYGTMLKDRIRVDAYLAALKKTVKPGCTVVDIGTGTGFFAIVACQLGAEQVYAIDPNDSVLIAKEIATANGVQDRIEFIQADSTEVVLPNKADVLIADLRGMIPLFGQHLHTILDARQRLLANGAVQIPQRDELFVAGIDDQALFDRAVAAAAPVAGVSMAPMLPYLLNTWMSLDSCDFPDDRCLLTNDACWHTIDYLCHQHGNVAGQARLVAHRPGTLHGYVMWFRATLVDGVQFDSRPKAEFQVYGNMFFPLSCPIPLETDEFVDVDLKATLMGPTYTWRWSTKHAGSDGQTSTAQRQSTFFGSPLSGADLRKRAADQTPNKTEKGAATMQAIAAMNGDQTLEQIANELLTNFPQQFSNAQAALGFAGDVALRFAN